MFLLNITYLWLHWVFIVASGFSSWAHGMWDLSPLNRDQTYIPCTGRQILKHWTTREVLCSYSFLFFNVCLFLSVLGLCFVCVWAFSSFGEHGLLFSCSAWASHCVTSPVAEHGILGVWASVAAAHGLDSCTSQAPAYRLSEMWHAGLVSLHHMRSSQIRDWTSVPCIGSRSLNHWTTSEALLFLKYIFKCSNWDSGS